jgi:prevent-host-death family protein
MGEFLLEDTTGIEVRELSGPPQPIFASAACCRLDERLPSRYRYGMRAVELSYAKAHLSRLVDEALTGEDIVISEAGTPLVRLAPVPVLRQRKFGLDQGKIVIRADFDEPLQDLEQSLYGSPDDPS